MAPPLPGLSPGYRSVFTSKRVSTQWKKLQLLDTWRKILRSLSLISSIAFPLAIQSVRGWVLSLCKQCQDNIWARNTKPCTSSQNNSRIYLLKRYEDGSNNCDLCLLQMNEEFQAFSEAASSASELVTLLENPQDHTPPRTSFMPKNFAHLGRQMTKNSTERWTCGRELSIKSISPMVT